MKKKNYQQPHITAIMLDNSSHLLTTSTDVVKYIDDGLDKEDEEKIEIAGSDEMYEGEIR